MFGMPAGRCETGFKARLRVRLPVRAHLNRHTQDNFHQGGEQVHPHSPQSIVFDKHYQRYPFLLLDETLIIFYHLRDYHNITTTL
jgi:hypothetical protein